METDWQTALEFAANRLRETVTRDGGDAIGMLISPTSTMEEGWLLKKIANGLECGNVDHRLRRSDFRLDGHFQGTPWMGCNITDIKQMDRMLIIGSIPRNEHPLLAHHIRSAVRYNDAELSLLNPLGQDILVPVANKVIVSPDGMVEMLLQVLKAVSGLERRSLCLCLPPALTKLMETVQVGDTARAIAESLAGHGKNYDLVSPRVGVFLGNLAQHHPRYAELYTLAEAIASLNGATFGVFSESNNRVGLNLARALPRRGALNSRSMLQQPRKTYILVNVEPELDCHNGDLAAKAMAEAECVIALATYKSETLRNADVLLPIAPFTETSGTFTSMEGRVQSFAAAVKPLGECRPGWKVLRVLGNLLGLEGFDFNSSDEVKTEIFGGEKPSRVVWNRLNNNLRELFDIDVHPVAASLQRIGDIPLYQTDSTVRRAPSLQAVGKDCVGYVSMNGADIDTIGLTAGENVRVTQANESVVLPLRRDDRLAQGCARVPVGPSTARLGDLFGDIRVEKLA